MAIATKVTRQLVAAGTSNAAGAFTRGAQTMPSALGGVLTFKVTNGATGPTAACVVNIMIAHDSTTLATGAAGAVWKTIYSIAANLGNNVITEFPAFDIPMGVQNIQIEFGGNTIQPVTCEAFISEVVSVG